MRSHSAAKPLRLHAANHRHRSLLQGPAQTPLARGAHDGSAARHAVALGGHCRGGAHRCGAVRRARQVLGPCRLVPHSAPPSTPPPPLRIGFERPCLVADIVLDDLWSLDLKVRSWAAAHTRGCSQIGDRGCRPAHNPSLPPPQKLEGWKCIKGNSVPDAEFEEGDTDSSEWESE